jgi:hypothetical protein
MHRGIGASTERSTADGVLGSTDLLNGPSRWRWKAPDVSPRPLLYRVIAAMTASETTAPTCGARRCRGMKLSFRRYSQADTWVSEGEESPMSPVRHGR